MYMPKFKLQCEKKLHTTVLTQLEHTESGTAAYESVRWQPVCSSVMANSIRPSRLDN